MTHVGVLEHLGKIHVEECTHRIGYTCTGTKLGIGRGLTRERQHTVAVVNPCIVICPRQLAYQILRAQTRTYLIPRREPLGTRILQHNVLTHNVAGQHHGRKSQIVGIRRTEVELAADRAGNGIHIVLECVGSTCDLIYIGTTLLRLNYLDTAGHCSRSKHNQGRLLEYVFHCLHLLSHVKLERKLNTARDGTYRRIGNHRAVSAV